MQGKRIITIAMTVSAVLAAAIFAPAGSQVVVVPSKEDRILAKLDLVLANQKEMRARLDRISRAILEEEKGAGKVARDEAGDEE